MANNDGMAPLPFAAGQTPGNRPTEVQHLRNLLHSEQHTNANQRRAIEALDREIFEMPEEPISARLSRRSRGLEAQSGGHDTAATPQTPPTGSPMALQRRRRTLRPSERLARMRNRVGSTENSTEGMEETSTTLHRPPPPIEPSDIAIQEYMGEAQFHRETRWRAKRRKLDDGTYEEEARTFSYGHNGQVVAGPLKLEIVSCDGGAYSEPSFGSSWPQNVLQDDTSVYCTKSNRCNMLLRHVGGMPFSLTKLVIKAPRSGYDAPIQEGMIFVAMNDDKILERTAPYEIRYAPRESRAYSRRELNYIRFGPSPEYMNSARSPLRSIDRSTYLLDPYPPQNLQEAENGVLDTLEGLLDVDLLPDFQVATTYENHSDNEGSPQRSPRTRRLSASYYNDFDRRYIPPVGASDYYRPTYHDTDNEADSQDSVSYTSNPDPLGGDLSRQRFQHPYNNPTARQRRLLRTRQIEQAYDVQAGAIARDIQDDFTRAYRQLDPSRTEYPNRRLRTRPSRIEVRPGSRRQDNPDVELPAEEEDQEPLSEEDPAFRADKEPLDTKIKSTPNMTKPHARFFIRRDKSSVSIDFDPPVAGRYILIRLWAPCPNANIDIQSVIAHGYGGPRFFPAYEPH